MIYTNFQNLVWEALKKIPRGRVTSYGEIAKFIGSPGAVRAVGTAVGKNPDAPRIPCHRVVQKGGGIGQYSGPGGVKAKIRMLEDEGVAVGGARVLDVKQKMFFFE